MANTNPLVHLHPDDMVLYQQVVSAMRSVAKQYSLRLASVTPHPDPHVGIDRLGDCDSRGNVRLILRFKDGRNWTEPRREDNVWQTAAHELAHLKHMNHGPAFQAFEQEMMQAMRNRQDETKDHRAKVLDKLVKLQTQREGEARIGNTAAAEAFASAINRMLIEHELNPSDIDYARAADNDPVIELRVDLEKYGIDRKSNRIAWQEALARVVARAHLCSFLICPGRNTITFVGTKSHATVAEYAYGILVPAASAMSIKAREEWARKAKADGTFKGGQQGYRESWLNAFVDRIGERFDEIRKAAVAPTPTDAPGAQSTGLIRLNGALCKVQAYVDAKYSTGRASYIRGGRASNAAGRADGRAAADRMQIGRKGINAGARGQLKA